MLPIAKVGVLLVLLGAGATGAYALTGGFGSGSGNGNGETKSAEATPNSAAPAEPAKPENTDDSPVIPQGGDVTATEGPRADAQEPEPVRSAGSNESGQNPTENVPAQNTVNGKEPGANESEQTSKGNEATQNAVDKVATSSEETVKAGGEEAKVTLGEEKTSLPNGSGSSDHSVET